MKWSCLSGHTGRWVSSEVISTRHHTPVYLNNILLTSSVVVTGNNWLKCHNLFQAINLAIPERNLFQTNQSLFVSPEIKSFWTDMTMELRKILKLYRELRFCGDGRSDSPGDSPAQYCTYVFMEHFSKLLVDLEVLDCRETSGISTRMEKEGLVRLLLRLKGQFDLTEIITDASTTVIKAISDLKNSHPEFYNKLFHSLDVWHKSKSLRKAMAKICKKKETEDLKQWVEPIINHFWHCSQNCNLDLKKFKVL